MIYLYDIQLILAAHYNKDQNMKESEKVIAIGTELQHNIGIKTDQKIPFLLQDCKTIFIKQLHGKYSDRVQIPAKAFADFLTVTLRYRARI